MKKILKRGRLIEALRYSLFFSLFSFPADPVAMFDFVHPCPDSVLKFLIDVFSAKETSEIFFTNDLYVLYDIILRQLVDREEKDKVSLDMFMYVYVYVCNEITKNVR